MSYGHPPHHLNQDEINLIKDLRKKNFSVRQIQELTGLSEPTILRYIPRGHILGRRRKRSKGEIIADILALLLNQDSIKTHIMYRANMSHTMTEKYLELLEIKGLIVRTGRIHSITEKGKKWYENYFDFRIFQD